MTDFEAGLVAAARSTCVGTRARAGAYPVGTALMRESAETRVVMASRGVVFASCRTEYFIPYLSLPEEERSSRYLSKTMTRVRSTGQQQLNECIMPASG